MTQVALWRTIHCAIIGMLGITPIIALLLIL